MGKVWKCILVDDDPLARIHLERLCKQTNAVELLRVFENGVAAREYLEGDENEAELVFLDMEMPGFTGLDLLRSLSKIPWVIITSSKKEYAADAFAYRENVIGYLSKPIELPGLLQAVSKLPPPQPQIGREMHHLFVKVSGKLVKIAFDDLLYVETVGDYVVFCTEKRQYLVYSTLKNVDEQLHHPDFLKVHRSYIVNLSKIGDIEEGSVVIGEKVIPVSRAHRSQLMERLHILE